MLSLSTDNLTMVTPIVSHFLLVLELVFSQLTDQAAECACHDFKDIFDSRGRTGNVKLTKVLHWNVCPTVTPKRSTADTSSLLTQEFCKECRLPSSTLRLCRSTGTAKPSAQPRP